MHTYCLGQRPQFLGQRPQFLCTLFGPQATVIFTALQVILHPEQGVLQLLTFLFSSVSVSVPVFYCFSCFTYQYNSNVLMSLFIAWGPASRDAGNDTQVDDSAN